MTDESPSNATTTQHAAANQQAQELTLLISAFLANIVLTLLVFLLRPSLFLQEMGEKQPAQAAPPQHAAANQQAYEATLLVPSLGHVLTLIIVAFRLIHLAEHSSENTAAHTLTPLRATTDRESR